MTPPDADHPRSSRPRSNTTTTSFSSFSAPWRKPKLSEPPSTTVAPGQIQPALGLGIPSSPSPSLSTPLSISSLITSLLPPTVPSLHNARALAAALCTSTSTRLPPHTALMPVLAALCAPDAPVPLQAVGFDIVSAYWENVEASTSHSRVAVAVSTGGNGDKGLDSLALADRMAYFALFVTPTGGAGGIGARAWSIDLWEPKFKALRALTKFGVEILGIEVSFFNLLKSWILDAFEQLFVSDSNSNPNLIESNPTHTSTPRAERAERERSIEILSVFLNSVVEKPEVMARITEEEYMDVLAFYGRLVDRCIDVSSASPPPPLLHPNKPTQTTSHMSTSMTSISISPQVEISRPAYSHHRQQSSISITSLPSPHPSSSLSFSTTSPPLFTSQSHTSSTGGSGPGTAKQPIDIAISLYITHLTHQLQNQLAPTAPSALSEILPLLFRALASCASPLAKLTITTNSKIDSGKRSFVEEHVSETLNSLLSGPYSATCLRILQRNLYPTSNANTSIILSPQAVQISLQTSFGAFRTLRAYIRRTLSTRLARAYISKESSMGYGHSGLPTHLDLSREVMESAWPRADFLGTSTSTTPGGLGAYGHAYSSYASNPNGWDAARFRKAVVGSTRAWVGFRCSDSPMNEASTGNEDVDQMWIKEGKERVMDEIAGILKDVLHEFESRDFDEDSNSNNGNTRLDEEEARTVGETLFELAGYVLVLKNSDGSPYLLPLSQPSSASTLFLQSLCFLLARALDHTTSIFGSTNTAATSTLGLSTILLHIASHLYDSDTASLFGIGLRGESESEYKSNMRRENQNQNEKEVGAALNAANFNTHSGSNLEFLSPTNPAWLANWKDLLESPLAMDRKKVQTRKGVMRVLGEMYENVKDLRG